MHLASALLFLWLLPTYVTADPPTPPSPTPPTPVVHVPDGPPAPPVPPPPPPPQGPLNLASDAILVVDGSVPCVVLVSPDGIATVTSYTGPVVFARTKFVDGPATPITRTYTNKYIYSIEAAGSGSAELIVIYTDAKGVQQIVRRALLVGGGPQPPTPPTPPTPPDSFTLALQAAYKADTDPAKAANVAALEALYGQAATVAVPNPAIVTVGDLTSTLHTAAVGMLKGGDAALPNVRKAIQTELATVLGNDASKPFDKTATAKEFTKVATALGTLTTGRK